MLRKLAAIGVLLPVLAAGCSYTSNGEGFLDICGTTLLKAPFIPAPEHLETPGPAPDRGRGPARDILPGKRPWNSLGPDEMDTYVQVSEDCENGVVVGVDPPDNAYLIKTAKAGDHRLAGLDLNLKGPVTIQAWRAGVFVGSVHLELYSVRYPPHPPCVAAGCESASPTRAARPGR